MGGCRPLNLTYEWQSDLSLVRHENRQDGGAAAGHGKANWPGNGIKDGGPTAASGRLGSPVTGTIAGSALTGMSGDLDWSPCLKSLMPWASNSCLKRRKISSFVTGFSAGPLAGT